MLIHYYRESTLQYYFSSSSRKISMTLAKFARFTVVHGGVQWSLFKPLVPGTTGTHSSKLARAYIIFTLSGNVLQESTLNHR
jgi:hypothetical protein